MASNAQSQPRAPKQQQEDNNNVEMTKGKEKILQNFKTFFDQIQSLAASTGFKAILSLQEETDGLRQQLDLRTSETAKIKKESEEKVQSKKKAIYELLVINSEKASKTDDLSKCIDSLTADIKKKDTIIAEKENNANNVKKNIDGLKQSRNEEKQKVTRANHEIGTLLKKLKEKDDLISQTKEAGSELGKQLASNKNAVQELTKDNKSLKQSLQTAQEKLQHFELLTAGYHQEEEDDMADRFTEIWEHAKGKLHPYLQTNFPEAVFKENQLAWDKFKERSIQDLRQTMPLPSSNSKAAKQMRFVIVLAILARQIDRYIFQPTYILPEDSRLREKLVELAAANENERESLCRLMLISVDPVSENRERDERIKTVVRNVSSYLCGLLPEPQYSSFRSELEVIARESADAWEPLRRSKKKYEPDFEPLKWDDDKCKPFVFPEDGTPEVSSLEQDSLIVFPRVSTVDKDERIPCTFTTQLQKTSPYYVSAYQESTEKASRPTARRTSSTRARRGSTAGSVGTSNAVNVHRNSFLVGRTSLRA